MDRRAALVRPISPYEFCSIVGLTMEFVGVEARGESASYQPLRLCSRRTFTVQRPASLHFEQRARGTQLWQTLRMGSSRCWHGAEGCRPMPFAPSPPHEFRIGGSQARCFIEVV
jgi:hypothetical protein